MPTANTHPFIIGQLWTCRGRPRFDLSDEEAGLEGNLFTSDMDARRHLVDHCLEGKVHRVIELQAMGVDLLVTTS
jgi:hypothetical protein